MLLELWCSVFANMGLGFIGHLQECLDSLLFKISSESHSDVDKLPLWALDLKKHIPRCQLPSLVSCHLVHSWQERSCIDHQCSHFRWYWPKTSSSRLGSPSLPSHWPNIPIYLDVFSWSTIIWISSMLWVSRDQELMTAIILASRRLRMSVGGITLLLTHEDKKLKFIFVIFFETDMNKPWINYE